MITLDRFAQFLKDSYEEWRKEQLRAGATSYQASQAQLARDARVTLASWSKLVAGNTTPSLATLAKLAAHPAIGPKVYDALGAVRPIDDPDLAAIAEDWPFLSQETKRAIIEMARARTSRTAQPAKARVAVT